MPKTIVIDFETFYDKDYHLRQKGMSYPQFIRDPRFHVFGMAVNYGTDVHGPIEEWVPGDRVPAWLEAHKGDILVAHQGFFDFAVLAWHYKFIPAYMVDTLLMANHVLGSSRDKGGDKNDLATIARKLGLRPKGKVEFMEGVRNPTEEQMRGLIAYALNDAALEREVLNILLPQFTNPDFEFWLMDHTIRIYLQRPLHINADKLKDVRAIVEKRQAELIEAAGVSKSVLASDKQFAVKIKEVLAAHKVRLPMKRAAKPRKDGTQPMIPALSKGDPAYLALTEHPIPEIANLVKARLVVRSAATVAARLATMQKYIDWGIGIPVHLIYYGAHTGRFSGGGGFNWQNLTNPDRAQDEIDKLIAQMIRDAVEAGVNRVFVEVDAAQIEARVLAWLAGEDQLLDDFAKGADTYSKFISSVINEEIRKPTKEEEANESLKAIIKHWKLMRQAGKIAVLGLGYQMGADKFFTQMRAKDRGLAKQIDAGKITLDMAVDIVEKYRSTYTKIADLWNTLNKAFHRARVGILTKVGPLTFKRIGVAAVAIVLPSGRALYYRNIRQEKRKTKKPWMKDDLEWKHGSGQKIYGGLLAENIVQAISRDILVEAVYETEKAGYPVALHVHDSVVGNVIEAQGQEALDFLVKTLSTPPPWGQGMVLSAEGHVGRSLGK